MKLYSHPRSGTHWTLALLEQAFYGTQTSTTRPTGHYSARWAVTTIGMQLWGSHCIYNARLPGPRLYLYRDGRDVALSLWRTKGFQPREWHSLSFSAFLRMPLDWTETPGRPARGPRLTIAAHWQQHLATWQHAPETLCLSYAALLRDPAAELARVAAFTGCSLRSASLAQGDYGPDASGDYRADKWRAAFSADDLDYFHSIVPRDHWGLYNGGGDADG